MKLLMLALFGQFAGLLSYFSVPDLRRLVFAWVSSSAVLMLVRYTFAEYYSAPRGVILIDFILSLAGLALVRLSFRVVRERYLTPQSRSHRQRRKVGIFGAGDVGASLA